MIITTLEEKLKLEGRLKEHQEYKTFVCNCAILFRWSLIICIMCFFGIQNTAVLCFVTDGLGDVGGAEEAVWHFWSKKGVGHMFQNFKRSRRAGEYITLHFFSRLGDLVGISIIFLKNSINPLRYPLCCYSSSKNW